VTVEQLPSPALLPVSTAYTPAPDDEPDQPLIRKGLSHTRQSQLFSNGALKTASM